MQFSLSSQDDLKRAGIILLYFKDYEADKFVKFDRYLKRVVRPLYNILHHRQKLSGFAVSFNLLRQSLAMRGWRPVVNNYKLAARFPNYPVGLVGYPTLLDRWSLPNAALLGPSLYDHPLLAPNLLRDPRFRTYLVLSQWMYDMFYPIYGHACVRWHAGIDTNRWHDTIDLPKDIDFLIYDKIRWDRDRLVAELLTPIQDILNRRQFRTEILRYKFHDHDTYLRLLRRSRAVVFLCEHETQGLAYQEALSCNVPVLAWDNGYWLDPLWRKVSNSKIPASSVPFFSEYCGERFASLDGFETTLNKFLDGAHTYRPRQYVLNNLSMATSGDAYASEYFKLL